MTRADIRRERRRARITIAIAVAAPVLVVAFLPPPEILPGAFLGVVIALSAMIVWTAHGSLMFLEDLEERIRRIADCSSYGPITAPDELERFRDAENRFRLRAPLRASRRRAD